MKQNIFITTTVIIAFLVSFTILFFFMNYYFEESTYVDNQKILVNSNENYILLFGTSYVEALNATHIENKLNSEVHSYSVPKIESYYAKDFPKIVTKVIELKPKMVIFGVGYRDLGYYEVGSKTCENDSQIGELNIRYSFKNLVNRISSEYEPISHILDIFNQNPKWVTVNSMNYLKQVLKTNNSENILLGNNQLNKIINPKYFDNILLGDFLPSSIKSIDELNQNDPHNYCLNLEWKEITLNSLDYSISKLKSNNIEVVIFTPPYVKSYNDKIPDNVIKNLDDSISELVKKNGVTYYNLSRYFENEDIFSDHTHIAKNTKSLQYSEKIVQLIEQSLT